MYTLKVANASTGNGIGSARSTFRGVDAMKLAPAAAWEEEAMLGVEEAMLVVAAFPEVDTLEEAMVVVEIAEEAMEEEAETVAASELERQAGLWIYPTASSDSRSRYRDNAHFRHQSLLSRAQPRHRGNSDVGER